MEIFNTLQQMTIEIPAAGLVDLWNNVLKGWLTPIYLAAVAVFAIFFLKDRAWMKLLAFVGIAAVVGVLIFAGSEIFGNKDSGLTGVAKNAAKDINMVNSANLVTVPGASFAELPNNFSD